MEGRIGVSLPQAKLGKGNSEIACLRQAYAGIVRPGAALLVKNAILYKS